MRTLIVGCGYLGQRVADLLLSRGDEVSALTRSEERAKSFADQNILAVHGNVLEPDSLRFQAVDRVIYSVGYDRSSPHSKRDTYVNGLQNVLSALPRAIPLTYVSSTSVYGQSDAEWVDEQTEPEPLTEGGRICLEAERALKADRPDSNVVRLAGIYGPGRVLRKLTAMQAGEPLAGNPDGFLNLIHVDDAARLVQQIADGDCERLVLGTDGQPSTRREFYSELARLTQTPEPIFDPTLPTRNQATGRGKRCRSTVIPNLSEFELQYPSYVEGLNNAVSQE